MRCSPLGGQELDGCPMLHRAAARRLVGDAVLSGRPCRSAGDVVVRLKVLLSEGALRPASVGLLRILDERDDAPAFGDAGGGPSHRRRLAVLMDRKRVAPHQVRGPSQLKIAAQHSLHKSAALMVNGFGHNPVTLMAKTARTRVASVREYIASKPKDSRASLEAVRRAILKAIPTAQEGLAYQMPAYTLDGVGVLYFAGWKAHYSLYPANDTLAAAFAKELAPYERRKGTIRFPLSAPVPVRLIERIAKFRARQVSTRHGSGAKRKGGKETQPDRIRRLCANLPSAFEKMSHGSPCFFTEPGKGCFAMLSEHH